MGGSGSGCWGDGRGDGGGKVMCRFSKLLSIGDGDIVTGKMVVMGWEWESDEGVLYAGVIHLIGCGGERMHFFTR